MKRLLIVLALVMGIGTFAATAAGADAGYTLTLTATPQTMQYGDETMLAGTLSAVPDTTSVAGYDVWINAYEDPECSSEPWELGFLTTGSTGEYGPAPLPISALGTFYFSATIYDGDAAGVTSNCVAVTVTSAEVVPTIPSDEQASSYLCWNKEMVNPVAYIDKTADAMWKTGNYFEPQAVLGNVVGGTNIGAYHLVCNASGTLKQTDMAVGGSGEVYDAIAAAQYHKEHPGGNDLNIYHIWK